MGLNQSVSNFNNNKKNKSSSIIIENKNNLIINNNKNNNKLLQEKQLFESETKQHICKKKKKKFESLSKKKQETELLIEMKEPTLTVTQQQSSIVKTQLPTRFGFKLNTSKTTSTSTTLKEKQTSPQPINNNNNNVNKILKQPNSIELKSISTTSVLNSNQQQQIKQNNLNNTINKKFTTSPTPVNTNFKSFLKAPMNILCRTSTGSTSSTSLVSQINEINSKNDQNLKSSPHQQQQQQQFQPLSKITLNTNKNNKSQLIKPDFTQSIQNRYSQNKIINDENNDIQHMDTSISTSTSSMTSLLQSKLNDTKMKMKDENKKKENIETKITQQQQQFIQQPIIQQKSTIPTFKQISQLKKPTKLNLNLNTKIPEPLLINNDTKTTNKPINPLNDQQNSSTSSTSINSLLNNNIKEDSAYSSLANSTINSQEIRSSGSSPRQKKQEFKKEDSIEHQINDNKNETIESIKYFKPILTPSKTHLKSFEIIETNNELFDNKINDENDKNIIKLRKSTSPPLVPTSIKKDNVDDQKQIEEAQDVNMSIDYETNDNDETSMSESVAPTTPTSSSVFSNVNNTEYIKLDLQTYRNLLDDFHSTKLLLYKLASIIKDSENNDTENSQLINFILKENLIDSYTQTDE